MKQIVSDTLVFRPAPPGDPAPDGSGRLQLPQVQIDVDATTEQLNVVRESVAAGALDPDEAADALAFAGVANDVQSEIGTPPRLEDDADWNREVEMSNHLERLSLVAVELVDGAQKQLLGVEPLNEIRVSFTPRAKAALVLGWEAIAKKGTFPLPPRGTARFEVLDRNPHGALHFVSASDLDQGYLYTMGIAQSPEAQSLGTMDATYGLDGELIVPGQAVSPIPPFMALATRLFAVSIPTSSNISEEVQSIPIRTFPHPTAIDDLEPRRGGRLKPPVRPRNSDDAITDLRIQLRSSDLAKEAKRRTAEASNGDTGGASDTGVEDEPDVGAAFEVTGLDKREIVQSVSEWLTDEVLAQRRQDIALYLNVEPEGDERVDTICAVVDAAKELGLKYVAVADDSEDSWLPNLLEYLEPDELNAVADYSDAAGIVVIDGRPVDPVYTASTAAQRIQSVYTTLAVDILKMGMWLCLDALAARQVWREIVNNPHIPRRMLLMPIGIVEPWNAFVDNRDPNKTPRAILDPFEKVKFMIEEAAVMGMPSLLTDTRHKETWVLLGRKTAADSPHAREKYEPRSGEPPTRTHDSAIPLMSWEHFMECERLARNSGILLGQAGSVEIDQLFHVITDCTYDAAKDGKNPATAIWTAETERVLRTSGGTGGSLQQQRGSAVSAFLAVMNRGFESHAKVDGWLRYLAEQDAGEEPLRQDLTQRRARLLELIDACIAAQAGEASQYQQSWDAFRSAYLEYHNLIKENFARIRDAVAAKWGNA